MKSKFTERAGLGIGDGRGERLTLHID